MKLIIESQSGSEIYEKLRDHVSDFLVNNKLPLEDSVDRVYEVFCLVDSLFGLAGGRAPTKNCLEQQLQINLEKSDINTWSDYNCLLPSLFFFEILKFYDLVFDTICTPNSPHPFFILYIQSTCYLASFGDITHPSSFRILSSDLTKSFIMLENENLRETFHILDLLHNFVISVTYKDLDLFENTYINALTIFDRSHPVIRYWEMRFEQCFD